MQGGSKVEPPALASGEEELTLLADPRLLQVADAMSVGYISQALTFQQRESTQGKVNKKTKKKTTSKEKK